MRGVAATLAAFLIAGAVAHAQNTELTPEPKPAGSEGLASQWVVLGGAKFDRGGELFSPTPPYTVDFFSTSFAPPAPDGTVSGTGFFAGAQCLEEVPFEELDEENCEREPAIYRLAEDEFGDPQIKQMALDAEEEGDAEQGGSDGDEPGFVGAVAWIDAERALAVGGTGTYPRREPETPVDDPGYVDPAGDARAWLYENGHWRELKDLPDGQPGDEIPDAMNGLTALDCSDGSYAPLQGHCLAGALQRLWWWRPHSSGAASSFDNTPVKDVPNAADIPDFHFRARAVEVAGAGAYVATSGCCAAPGSPLAGPRVLTYDSTKSPDKSWKSDQGIPAGAFSFSARRGGSEAIGGAGSATLPDSYYDFGGTSLGPSAVVASPGGAPTSSVSEPGSRIIGLIGDSNTAYATDRALDSVRLLAADDRGPAWAVGGLKESGLGVAYAPAVVAAGFGDGSDLVEVPQPLSCTPSTSITFLLDVASCADQPMPEKLTEASAESKRLVGMGTYSLNSIASVPGTGGRTLWAAGDSGALARFGGEGGVGSQDEPKAPFIRPRGESALGEREPFEPFRPSSAAAPGTVPPVAAQPVERLTEPTLVPYGTDDPMPPSDDGAVSAFAMSRDGSEGWGIGTAPHHFDGERWMRCSHWDPNEQELVPPDEACGSLLEAGEGVTLSKIVRVPLEQDSKNPTNDDEFAAIALGKVGGETRALKYHEENGWKPDPEASRELGGAVRNVSVVFRAPDDGWFTAQSDGGSISYMFHYTGGDWPNGHWESCAGLAAIANCGAGIARVPINGTGQLQLAGDTLYIAGTRGGRGVTYPFVAAKELDSDAPWRMEYDPGCPETQRDPPPTTAPTCSGSLDGSPQQGTVYSFSVVKRGDGATAGWLLGQFGPSLNTSTTADAADATREARKLAGSSSGNLIRRDPDSGEWSLRSVEDAAADYLPAAGGGGEVMSFKGPGGEERSVIVPPSTLNVGRHPWLRYDQARDRWGILPAPFVSNTPKFQANHSLAIQGGPISSEPDGQGGFWSAVKQGMRSTVDVPGEPVNRLPTYFYHYTDRAPEPVFDDAAHPPIREMISDLDGTAEGVVWVSTHYKRRYRYDRITGWERVPIPGWDPGRTPTNPSRVDAVAVNDSGVGVAVGREGRIADISLDAVRLDEAAGRRCSDLPQGQKTRCGTPQDLFAAAVAPDGSALVGGDNLTLMWRPAGGAFRLVDTPLISTSTLITGITLPVANEAWLTTGDGQIWKGTLVGSNWDWGRAAESPSSNAADQSGWSRLNDIAVDATGRGLAVGSRGAMLERSPDGSWQRLDTGYLDSLYSIALPPSGYGDGTLVGGSVGVVLTRIGGAFHVARRSDIFDPVTSGHGSTAAARIVGLAIAGGGSDGDVDAWAASQMPGSWSMREQPTGALLHYTNSDDQLLNLEERSEALLDARLPEQDELTIAAFGRSECQVGNRPRFCPEFQGTNMFSEVVTRRITGQLSARNDEAQGGLVGLSTGDIASAPGRERGFFTPVDANITHNAWRQFVPESLAGAGIPLFGALGMNDLWSASACPTFPCLATRDIDGTSLSLQWRESFAGMPSPWGQGDDALSKELEFEPVEASPAGVNVDDGSARTHYAADISRDGKNLARLVVVDNSLGSLAESTVNQNPVEEQQTWLEGVLCFDGGPEDTNDDIHDCTRERGQEAIVLANYPTYTYATNISPTDVATDGALFESTLLRYDVDVLIAGRLGWNGLYYTCAPGLHYPHPGQGYPERAPKGLAECAAAAGGADAPSQLSDLASDATDAVSGTPTGALPVVVASGAGGRFGPRGDSDGSASEGFWRGYSIVRIDPDTGRVTVEQRPVLDWVGLDTPQLVIEPGERVELYGYGREPAAIDVPLRYIDIDSPAVTHRYDLLLADPDEPWVPCEASDEGCAALHSKLAAGSSSLGSARDDMGEACEPYLCLPENVAAIDDQTGAVRAGKGKYPDTFAIALLSIGDHAATQPLYFKKSPSFIVAPVLGFPAIPSTPTSTAGAPAPPPPPPPPTPNVPHVNTPTPPAPPPLAPLQATQPPEPQPPAPPAPPPPTEQPSPLNLTLAPPSITVATPTAVIQPPTPPVNPAPPGGARREARQRQAAAQKSGADSENEEQGSDAINRVNKVETEQQQAATRRHRPGSGELSATRRDRVKPGPSFTSLPGRQAWASDPGVLYVGGISLGALVLALGWGTLRPTPRRREPRLPAPASAWTYGRRR